MTVNAKDVKDFHAKDDVDSSPLAHHHTLGFGSRQAAPGGQTMNLIKRLQISAPRVGDILLSVSSVETETFKICNGQTLVGDYPDLLLVHGSLTLPDLSADVPAGTPTGNYFMRVI